MNIIVIELFSHDFANFPLLGNPARPAHISFPRHTKIGVLRPASCQPPQLRLTSTRRCTHCRSPSLDLQYKIVRLPRPTLSIVEIGCLLFANTHWTGKSHQSVAFKFRFHQPQCQVIVQEAYSAHSSLAACPL